MDVTMDRSATPADSAGKSEVEVLVWSAHEKTLPFLLNNNSVYLACLILDVFVPW